MLFKYLPILFIQSNLFNERKKKTLTFAIFLINNFNSLKTIFLINFYTFEIWNTFLISYSETEQYMEYFELLNSNFYININCY